jgi:hypothetical protein
MMNAMSIPSIVDTNTRNRVEMWLPADAKMLFLARMTAAAVATRVDLNFEQVEDLRLAVDELCIGLLGAGIGAGQIALLFQWDDDGTLDVVGSLVPQADPAVNDHAALESGHLAHELSQQILDALVDEHGADDVGGVPRAWVRMRRRDSSA